MTDTSSVADPDPDPGSGAFLTPGSGIRNRFFPDPGSQTHIFEDLVTIFWVKSLIILGKLGKIFSSAYQNKIIFSFVKFVAAKNGLTKKFFHPCLLLLFLDPGSEIRDPGWVKIRIRDPG
jgi:hypothetical protein